MTGPAERDARAVLARASELTREHQYEEAAKLVEEAMERFPADPAVRLRAGALALMAQQPTRAKQHLRQAVDLAPDDPAVLTHAAWHMESMQDHETAEVWIKDAARLAPDHFELAGHLSYLMSRVLLSRGYPERAEELARAAFEDDPAVPEYGEMLAALLEGRSEPDEARAVIEEALSHAPGNPSLESALERLILQEDAMRTLAEFAELLQCCGQEWEAAWNSAGELSLEDLRLEPSDGCDLTLEEVRKRQRELTERFARMPLTVERG